METLLYKHSSLFYICIPNLWQSDRHVCPLILIDESANNIESKFGVTQWHIPSQELPPYLICSHGNVYKSIFAGAPLGVMGSCKRAKALNMANLGQDCCGLKEMIQIKNGISLPMWLWILQSGFVRSCACFASFFYQIKAACNLFWSLLFLICPCLGLWIIIVGFEQQKIAASRMQISICHWVSQCGGHNVWCRPNVLLRPNLKLWPQTWRRSPAGVFKPE